MSQVGLYQPSTLSNIARCNGGLYGVADQGGEPTNEPWPAIGPLISTCCSGSSARIRMERAPSCIGRIIRRVDRAAGGRRFAAIPRLLARPRQRRQNEPVGASNPTGHSRSGYVLEPAPEAHTSGGRIAKIRRITVSRPLLFYGRRREFARVSP